MAVLSRMVEKSKPDYADELAGIMVARCRTLFAPLTRSNRSPPSSTISRLSMGACAQSFELRYQASIGTRLCPSQRMRSFELAMGHNSLPQLHLVRYSPVLVLSFELITDLEAVSPRHVGPNFAFPFPSPTANASSLWGENRNDSSSVTPDRDEHNHSYASGGTPQSSSLSSFGYHYASDGSLGHVQSSQKAPGLEDSYALPYDDYVVSNPGALEMSIGNELNSPPQADSSYVNVDEAESNEVFTSTQVELDTLHEEVTLTVANVLNNIHEEKHPTSVHTPPAVDDQILPLSTHLLDMFAIRKYSDVRIVLKSMRQMFSPVTFNVHRIIVSQSPVLESILQHQETSSETNSTIHINAAGNFSMARAFEFALQNMYGQPLINKDNVNEFTQKALGWNTSNGREEGSENVKEKVVGLAVCYGAAGLFLNNTDIVNAELGLIMELFDWSNIETALHFALYPDDFLLTYDGNKMDKAKKKRVKRRKDKDKAETTADGLPSVHIDGSIAQIIQVWSRKVASAAIRFMVYNLPATFHFDRTALPKTLKDRIPQHICTGYSIANLNPMLASLTFGQHPQPSPTCTRASAILLALPFEHFRDTIEVMQQQRILTADLVKAILLEREERRLSALWEYARQSSDNQGDNHHHPDDSVKELCYQEFAIHVQTLDATLDGERVRDEFTLHREWKGYQGSEYGSREPVIRKFGGGKQ